LINGEHRWLKIEINNTDAGIAGSKRELGSSNQCDQDQTHPEQYQARARA
jgi:hypothetical protein